MASGHLSRSVSVQFDGSGNGTASVGPVSAREVWHVTTATVAASSNTAEATCNIFVGDSPLPQNRRDGTFSGSSGDVSSAIAGDVKCGHKVWAVWSGGDPLARGTLTIVGTTDIS